MREDIVLDPAIVDAASVLSETYVPAHCFNDAAKRFTSSEVAEAIFQLTGQQVSNEIVFEIMQSEGYRFVIDETSSAIKYVWLLKYRIR